MHLIGQVLCLPNRICWRLMIFWLCECQVVFILFAGWSFFLWFTPESWYFWLIFVIFYSKVLIHHTQVFFMTACPLLETASFRACLWDLRVTFTSFWGNFIRSESNWSFLCRLFRCKASSLLDWFFATYFFWFLIHLFFIRTSQFSSNIVIIV